MTKCAIILEDGVEEMEAVIVIDLIRRSGIDVLMVGGSAMKVTTAHDITMECDLLYEEVDWAAVDGVILPGGGGGTDRLLSHPDVTGLVQRFASEGKLVAAVCAAPMVLYQAGLLTRHPFTCYPGVEQNMDGVARSEKHVVKNGNIITSQGPGTTSEFALSIVEYFAGKEIAQNIAEQTLFS